MKTHVKCAVEVVIQESRKRKAPKAYSFISTCLTTARESLVPEWELEYQSQHPLGVERLEPFLGASREDAYDMLCCDAVLLAPLLRSPCKLLLYAIPNNSALATCF